MKPRDLKLNRTSAAYRRMTCAGFTISEPYVGNKDDNDRYFPVDTMQMRVNFKCVCGREEIFVQIISAGDLKYNPLFKGGLWDAALSIERAGAVGVDHLRADGFDEEAIKRIRYVYDLEDELKELRAIAERYYVESGNFALAEELRRNRRYDEAA